MENFNKVHNRLRPRVLGYLTKMIGDRELAEDLTNDTMIKVWNNFDKFNDDISKIDTWVLNIARNVSIDNWRKKELDSTSINNFITDDGDVYLEAKTTNTPLSDVLSNEIGEGIQLAINKLPKNYRKVANLFFNEQLKYEEIASGYNIPIGTVKVFVHRSKRILQESLHSFR